MSFQDYIISILSSAFFSSVTVALIIWLTREWLSARIKGSIQHEYDQKLESYKAQLKANNEIYLLELKSSVEKEAALHAAAHSSFSEGQKAAMERKLNAVDKLWDQVIRFRIGLPSVIKVIDWLTFGEYTAIKNISPSKKFSEELEGLSIENITGLINKDFALMENVRPYVGEYMWALFDSYRLIMIRILFLLETANVSKTDFEWYKNSSLRRVMEAVLETKEIEEFDKLQVGKISWLQNKLENKILTASAKIISGEGFGEESLKQARLIQDLSAKLQTEKKIKYEEAVK